MSKTNILFACLAGFIVLSLAIFGIYKNQQTRPDSLTENQQEALIIAQNQQSHINAHAPEKADFEKAITRDLIAYFQENNAQVDDVSYTLLRKNATQSGVSFPKYYAWVDVKNSEDRILKSGVVRLAASQKTAFTVTHYVSSQDINASPSSLDMVLPSALIPAAKDYASKQ